jgi:hypothetical protein
MIFSLPPEYNDYILSLKLRTKNNKENDILEQK